MVRFKRSSRTSSKYIYYALQLFFSGLSLRKTSERLSTKLIRRRNHVSIWNWIQRYKPLPWTAIGEWSGVPMNYIISVCQPLPQARYVVFYSYQYSEGEQFYEAIYMELSKHHQTILAYEMNGEPLIVPHGSPLLLRIETKLGFKMVKWIKFIEFVSDYKK